MLILDGTLAIDLENIPHGSNRNMVVPSYVCCAYFQKKKYLGKSIMLKSLVSLQIIFSGKIKFYDSSLMSV